MIRSGPDRQWVEQYALPALITLLALALQLYALDAKSLWFDELATLFGSGWGGDWLDAIRNPLAIPLTPKPPLSFVITRLFLALDESVFLLRLPSVVFATLAIPLTYALGRVLLDRQVGLLGALLLAFAPLHIRYAQEARMYALFTFLSLLSLYLFWRAIRSSQGRWWIGFVVMTVLNLYTHLFAAFPLGVLTLFAFWLLLRPRARSRYPFRVWHLLAALLAISLLFLPMAPYISQGLASEEGLGGSAARDWDLSALLGALRLSSGGSDLGTAVYALFFLLAAVALWSKNRDVLLLALVWIGLPLLLVLLTPFGHDVRVRYFIFALPIYLLMVACGLKASVHWLAARFTRRRPSGSLPPRVQGLMAAALAAILVAIGLPSTSAYYAETKQNWRDAFWVVHSQSEPGDQVFVPRLYQQVGALFYAQQWAPAANPLTADNVHVLPPDLGTLDLSVLEGKGVWVVAPHKKRFLPGGELESSIQPAYRLSEPTVFEPSSMPRDLDIIGTVSFGDVLVVRLVPAPPPFIHFWADEQTIDRGNCTWLNWETENVREVYLDSQGVVGHDRREVCPTTTTTYQLEVILPVGSTMLSTVEVSVTTP